MSKTSHISETHALIQVSIINLKHIQKQEILYEFVERSPPICHVLLAVQNTYHGALLSIDNRQFIGFLHKQIETASTDINLLSRFGPKRYYIQTYPTSCFLSVLWKGC